MVMLIAAAACAIVNLAVSGALTWALYPLLSIALAWIVLTLLLMGGERRVAYALGALCILVFPYLTLLDRIGGAHGWARAIGHPVAAVGVLYLAGVYAMLRFSRWNGWTRAGAIVAGAGVVSVACELLASRYTGVPLHWVELIDTLSCLAAAAVLIGIGWARRPKGRGTAAPHLIKKARGGQEGS